MNPPKRSKPAKPASPVKQEAKYHYICAMEVGYLSQNYIADLLHGIRTKHVGHVKELADVVKGDARYNVLENMSTKFKNSRDTIGNHLVNFCKHVGKSFDKEEQQYLITILLKTFDSYTHTFLLHREIGMEKHPKIHDLQLDAYGQMLAILTQLIYPIVVRIDIEKSKKSLSTRPPAECFRQLSEAEFEAAKGFKTSTKQLSEVYTVKEEYKLSIMQRLCYWNRSEDPFADPEPLRESTEGIFTQIPNAYLRMLEAGRTEVVFARNLIPFFPCVTQEPEQERARLENEPGPSGSQVVPSESQGVPSESQGGSSESEGGPSESEGGPSRT